jgi:competence protein ComFC
MKITNFFFPKYCLACSNLGAWLCFSCYKQIKFKKNTCFICRKISDQGEICPLCRYQQGEKGKEWQIHSLIWVSDYDNKVLKKLIMALKYGGVKEIAKILAKLINKKIQETWPNKSAILIPVPISEKRKKVRGYNQAELIAQAIADNNPKLKLKTDLKIIKIGQQQTKKKIKNRWQKTHQFAWQGENLENQTIIIIDDVITTGATLNQAALALKEVGAKNIQAATVLRA